MVSNSNVRLLKSLSAELRAIDLKAPNLQEQQITNDKYHKKKYQKNYFFQIFD